MSRIKILFSCTGNSCRSQMAKEETTEEGAMVHYRRVRDEIRAFVESLPGSLQK